MHLSDFQFPFDPTLVAEQPIHPRDHARLLVVNRQTQQLMNRQVKDLPDILRPGDVLVVNDTKVIPARLWGTKVPTGGKVELLFVRQLDEQHMEILLNGRVSQGQLLKCPGGGTAQVIERQPGRTVIRWQGEQSFQDCLAQHGEVPLPPYIKRQPLPEDRRNYQTVFAQHEGAIAAPTAGLHFTQELLSGLDEMGVKTVTLTLHVGPGTFLPVKVSDVEAHVMHPEWFQISEQAVQTIQEAKRAGGRVIAVGTTAARSLESAVDEAGRLTAQSGETRLFIIPGFSFKVVDVLLTNFHFPETTLLMLVSAFAGLELARTAYEHAVQERYRFYSYGDAMLLE
ncbi:MAG: tRNA preQ1(34) S-adenosylmethionine ribosyltransferase-isomerase QueA [Nitrospirales bacterium]